METVSSQFWSSFKVCLWYSFSQSSCPSFSFPSFRYFYKFLWMFTSAHKNKILNPVWSTGPSASGSYHLFAIMSWHLPPWSLHSNHNGLLPLPWTSSALSANSLGTYSLFSKAISSLVHSHRDISHLKCPTVCRHL